MVLKWIILSDMQCTRYNDTNVCRGQALQIERPFMTWHEFKMAYFSRQICNTCIWSMNGLHSFYIHQHIQIIKESNKMYNMIYLLSHDANVWLKRAVGMNVVKPSRTKLGKGCTCFCSDYSYLFLLGANVSEPSKSCSHVCYLISINHLQDLYWACVSLRCKAWEGLRMHI